MKEVLVALLLCAEYTALAAQQEELPRHPYPRLIQFPDGDGVMHQVDLEGTPDLDHLDEIAKNPAQNLYLLYTKRNPDEAQTLVINDLNSITSSNFNPNASVAVIVHGWLSNRHTKLNPVIRDAYLGDSKSDTNVIVVDWHRLAFFDYVTAVRGVPAVGRGLGQFLAFLNSATGTPFDSMHLIGFSLGAHVVGNAGRELGGRVARVTGLDPAGPLWHNNHNRLDPNDGIYVEAIHTDGGYLIDGFGIGCPVANADFFVNGGIFQPGCLTNICNHNRSWQLFAASVDFNHLVATECSNFLQIALDTCRGQYLRMGNDDLNKRGAGLYRLDTGRRYPF